MRPNVETPPYRRARAVAGQTPPYPTVIAVAACTVLLAACSPGIDESAAWPAARVALAPVVREAAPRALHGVGELQAQRQVALAPEVAGRITRIAFVAGQRVEQGQVLVQLNDAAEQAERVRRLAQARNAESVLVRARRLLADRVGTQEQLDHAQAARDMARGELQQIEAVIAQKTITAPFAGVIGLRRVHEGQYVHAGEVMASLVDAAALEVKFALDAKALAHVQPGQPVTLQVDAWPGERFRAKVQALDPLIGPARTLQVQASLPNPDGRLLAGMFASVQVQPAETVVVLTVPETAVSYAAYGQTVFVAEPGAGNGLRARRVAIRTGERWGGRVEIVSGLGENDRVVVSGQTKLSDGTLIEPLDHDALQDGASGAPGRPGLERAA